MKKQILKKGFTVEVTSWENDGDNYRTMSATYDTKLEAVEVYKLLKGTQDIGNMMEDEYEEAYLFIVDYLIKNPILLTINNITTPDMHQDKVQKMFPEATDENWEEFLNDFYSLSKNLSGKLVDCAMEYNYDLMGGSEYYYSRVFESGDVWESPEDIFIETITP